MNPNEEPIDEKPLDAENFRAKEVSIMSRSEKRSRKRYYKKLLKDHEKAKPTVNLEKEGQEAFDQQMRLQRWATRYGILRKKLEELG